VLLVGLTPLQVQLLNMITLFLSPIICLIIENCSPDWWKALGVGKPAIKADSGFLKNLFVFSFEVLV
jgi:hypothetical protein